MSSLWKHEFVMKQHCHICGYVEIELTSLPDMRKWSWLALVLHKYDFSILSNKCSNKKRQYIFYIYVYMYICMYIYIYLSICVCVCVCVCVWVGGWVGGWVYIYIGYWKHTENFLQIPIFLLKVLSKICTTFPWLSSFFTLSSKCLSNQWNVSG